MSQDLMVEIDTLKQENTRLNMELNKLNAQLQATSQAHGEAVQTGLHIRANLVVFQKVVEEQNSKIADLTKSLSEVTSERDNSVAEVGRLKALMEAHSVPEAETSAA